MRHFHSSYFAVSLIIACGGMSGSLFASSMIIDDLSDSESSPDESTEFKRFTAKRSLEDRGELTFPVAFDETRPAKRLKLRKEPSLEAQVPIWPIPADDRKESLNWRTHSQYPVNHPTLTSEKGSDEISSSSMSARDDELSESDEDQELFEDAFHRLVYQCLNEKHQQYGGNYAELISCLVKGVGDQSICPSSWPLEIDDSAFQKKILVLFQRVKRTISHFSKDEIALPDVLEVLSFGVDDTAKSIIEKRLSIWSAVDEEKKNDNQMPSSSDSVKEEEEGELIEDLIDYFHRLDLSQVRAFIQAERDFRSIEGDAFTLSLLLNHVKSPSVRSLKNCFLFETLHQAHTHNVQHIPPFYTDLALWLREVSIEGVFLLHNPTFEHIVSVAQDQRISELLILFDTLPELLIRDGFCLEEGQYDECKFDHVHVLKIEMPTDVILAGGVRVSVYPQKIMDDVMLLLAKMKNLKNAEIYVGKTLYYQYAPQFSAGKQS